MYTNSKNYQKVHAAFCFNGKSFSEDSLAILVKELVNSKEDEKQAIGVFFKQWLNTNSYIEVSTSGSTGVPKVIKVAKQYMINSAIATGDFFKTQEKTKALLCLSANYIAGKMMLVRAMVLGWHIDTVPPTSIPLKTVIKKYDFCAMVPIQLNNSLNRIEHMLI